MGKLFNYEEKCHSVKSNELIVALCFLGFLIYLVFQHRLIGMYYDDFGNASLSYGYDSTSIVGTDYSLTDLLLWAKNTYFNWGGRVLYALILIPLLKYGSSVYMLIQAFIILFIFIGMYFITKKFSEKSCGIILFAVFVLLYGLLQGNILTQGFYWASASVLYVWPMLPFMLVILLFLNLEEKMVGGNEISPWYYVCLIVLIPFVTLSQEQIGGSFVVWIIGNALIGHYKNNKIFLKLDCLSIGYSIITFGIFLAAPGNWVRLSTNESYAKLSFVEKILDSTPKVFSLLTNSDLKYFNLILLIVGIVIIITTVHKKRYILLSAAGIIPFLIIDLLDICGTGIFSYEIKGISFGLFLLDMFFLLCFYFNLKNNKEFMAIMIAAVASVFCLVVSPAFATRSCIPYVFFCMILCAIVFSNLWNDLNAYLGKIIGIVICIPILIFCIKNTFGIYKGYEENYYADRLNFKILSNYNGIDNRIYLLNYENGIYRSSMPCDKGFEYVAHWMKEYFNIPENVDFVYKTAYELFQYAKDNEIDVIYGEGFYDIEGTFCWAQNSAKLQINNYEYVNQVVNLTFQAYTGYEQNSNIQIWCDEIQIYDGQINADGTTCNLELELVPGENIIEIVTDAKQIDSGADSRNLFMRISDLRCEKRVGY